MPGEFHETIQPLPTLKEVLIKSTLSPNVSLPGDIPKINLGVLGQEADNLLDRSLRDPQGLERGRMIYITPDGKLLLQSEDSVGVKDESGQKTRANIHAKRNPLWMSLPRHMQQDRFFGGVIHSHGVHDLPPSPRDFTPLFSSVSSIGIAPMLFVITPEIKSVYFRSPNTPQWDDATLQKNIQSWEEKLMNQIRGKIRPGMSYHQQVGINALETHQFIRSLQDRYQVKLFSCPTDKNIAVKETA